jgi:hypothetical protein
MTNSSCRSLGRRNERKNLGDAPFALSGTTAFVLGSLLKKANQHMPLFYFNLNDGKRVNLDSEGTELPDEACAEQHAVLVAREIMRNNRARTLTWRVQVCDSRREPYFELLFASVSQDLDHFPVALRDGVTVSAGRVSSLNDNIREVRRTLLQLRATLARADRTPYLAALNGTPVER